MPRTPIRSQWVYFIDAGGQAVKIGMADDVRKRMMSLQGANHEKLTLIVAFECYNARESEGFLHCRFMADRIRGEWFARSDALDALLLGIQAGDPASIAEHFGTGRVQYPTHIKRHPMPDDVEYGPTAATLVAIGEAARALMAAANV